MLSLSTRADVTRVSAEVRGAAGRLLRRLLRQVRAG